MNFQKTPAVAILGSEVMVSLPSCSEQPTLLLQETHSGRCGPRKGRAGFALALLVAFST